MEFKFRRLGFVLFAAGSLLLMGGEIALWGQDRDRNYAEEFNKADLNKNGLLEFDEIPSELRRNVYRYAERAGLDPRKPSPVNKLVEAVVARQEAKAAEAAASGGTPAATPMTNPASATPAAPAPAAGTPATPPSSSTSSSKSTPKVPGFGEKDLVAKVPGFNVPISISSEKPIEQTHDPRVVERVLKVLRDHDRNNDGVMDLEEASRGQFSNPSIEDSDLNKDGKLTKYELAERYRKRHDWNGPPSASASSSSSQKTNAPPPSTAANSELSKVKGYAESLLKQYDLNKNGLLEKDEWMQMKSEYHKADQNGDNVLTLDELVAKLGGNSPMTASTSSPSPAPPSGFSGSSSSSSSTTGSYPGVSKATLAAAKKAGRFLTPTERLPKGLPDWFLRNDADGDGQVAMSEYAAAWSEATAADFMKYDLDGDGVITPEECLLVLKKK